MKTVQAMLDEMLGKSELPAIEPESQEGKSLDIPEAFQVVVECRDEQEQQAVYDRLVKEGYSCKLLNL